MEFTTTELWLTLLHTAATIISSITGFGGMLLFFGLGSFLLPDVKVLLFLSAISGWFKVLTSAYLFRADIQWPIVRRTLLYGFPFTAVGAYLNGFISSRLFQLLIGAFILLFLLSRSFPPHRRPRLTLQSPALAPSLGVWGFISGLVGAGGPIIVAIMQALSLPKRAFVATLQLLFLISISIKGPFYYHVPSPYTDNLPLISLFIVLSILGSFIGKALNDRLSESFFQKLVITLLFISAINLLL